MEQQIKHVVRWAEDTANDRNSLSDSDKVLQIFNSLPVNLGPANFRKVLAANILPEANTWSICRKAEAAGITRDTWYRTIRKPAFRDASIALAKIIIGHSASSVAAAFITNALTGDSKAQIRALEELGILKSQSTMPGGATPGPSLTLNLGINVIAESPPAERDKFRRDYVAAVRRMCPSDN